MMKKRFGIGRCTRICAIALGAMLLVSAAGFAADAKAPATLDNLMKAFDGESNANARYIAFAKKADEDGYGAVASLFRAAATAEEIHFNAHAEAIKTMGGTPKADIKAPDVKSTKENLEAAVKGESYERDTMYPEFIDAAKKEKNNDAIRTFMRAKAAEADHAKLYQEAIDNLDKWKGGKKDFFVCPVCGHTIATTPAENCPVCATAKDKFKKVS
jgi:rubrerythrin